MKNFSTGLVALMHVLKKKLNPARYQGSPNKSVHFEGWYFKMIDYNECCLYAVIPGVFINRNNTDSHSFIQIFDGINNHSCYFRFPIDDFQSRDNVFDIQINANHFSSEKMVLDLKNASFEIHGELQFTDLISWPGTIISPGIMGWYTWVPFMECYHAIVSLHHKIHGALSINRKQIDFSKGTGYTEKDWGKSFPDAWIWCQCNHFNETHVGFTGSIAIIPWIRRPFPGFIFGLWYQGRLYRFATYTGAKLVHLEINDKQVTFMIKQKQLSLEVTAYQQKTGFLQAPTINGMTHQISETLQSIIEVKLTSGTGFGKRILFNDVGRHAGFETGGNVHRLMEMYQKNNH